MVSQHRLVSVWGLQHWRSVLPYGPMWLRKDFLFYEQTWLLHHCLPSLSAFTREHPNCELIFISFFIFWVLRLMWCFWFAIELTSTKFLENTITRITGSDVCLVCCSFIPVSVNSIRYAAFDTMSSLYHPACFVHWRWATCHFGSWQCSVCGNIPMFCRPLYFNKECLHSVSVCWKFSVSGSSGSDGIQWKRYVNGDGFCFIFSHWKVPSVLWRCWLGGRKGIRPVKNRVVGCWHGCLEQGTYLHMAQLMPLPLTVSCFSKTQIGFTSLVPAHLGSSGQRAVKQVCVSHWKKILILVDVFSHTVLTSCNDKNFHLWKSTAVMFAELVNSLQLGQLLRSFCNK